MQPQPPVPSGAARPWRPTRAVHAIGLLVAAAAIALCVRAVVDAWPEVRSSIAHANPGWLCAGFVASCGSMCGLALLWWRCLRLFGVRVALTSALAWYFAGELGKYLPGGIWSVIGRVELARRSGGLRRGAGYATTLICYACMTLAAALVCAVLAPIAAARHAGIGWAWALLALIPLSIAAAHPVVVNPLLSAASRLSRGRVELTAPPWAATLRLLAAGVPSWLLLGAAAVAVTEALGYDQDPVRVAFAAVAAWIVGFLAVPVPAGAGVRELVFVVLCGLAAGPAAAVAAISRALLLLVDAVGGVAGLYVVGARGRNRAQD